MKFQILIFLLLIVLIQSQHHDGRPGDRHNETNPRGNQSQPQGPPPPGNFSMNHTHQHRPTFNFSNFANYSESSFQMPYPPFLNDSNFSLFENYSEQELTHYEESFFDSLKEILSNAFNHSDEEINQFRENMTSAYNETYQNDYEFNQFFQDFLNNMSNSVSQDIDYYNIYEPEDDELKNVFMLLDESSNKTVNEPAKDLLQVIQKEMQKQNIEVDSLFELEKSFVLMIDQLQENQGINSIMADLIKLQVHNAIQQKYQQIWMAQEINDLVQLKSNPSANQQEIQQKQFIIQLQNQTLIRNKLLSLLEDQLLENVQESSKIYPLPESANSGMDQLLNAVNGILYKQELHYDIQELYEQLEEEIKFLNSTERENDIRAQAIRVLNNSASTQEELSELKQNLQELLEAQFTNVDNEKSYQNGFYYFYAYEQNDMGAKKSSNTFLVVVIIILILIIVFGFGYYIYIRQKKRNDLMKFSSGQETNGFFKQIDESVKV